MNQIQLVVAFTGKQLVTAAINQESRLVMKADHAACCVTMSLAAELARRRQRCAGEESALVVDVRAEAGDLCTGKQKNLHCLSPDGLLYRECSKGI